MQNRVSKKLKSAKTPTGSAHSIRFFLLSSKASQDAYFIQNSSIFSDAFFGYLQKTAKLKMLTGCPKNFFSDFFSRFWKSLNIPTKWCLNHSSSSMIRKFMTLWSLKICQFFQTLFLDICKKLLNLKCSQGVKKFFFLIFF